ncbi:MAG: hypothetical protein EOP40_04970 [Rubrivivax sp.]|nr:MAG: hypothetical protein EOP40_04970 [Rubrivivax sp.]
MSGTNMKIAVLGISGLMMSAIVAVLVSVHGLRSACETKGGVLEPAALVEGGHVCKMSEQAAAPKQN